MAILETDPLDVQLDESGDILIDQDGAHFVSGLSGVAQLIRIAVRLYLAEWFLNQEKGMPWYQEILGEKYDEGLLRFRLEQVILGVPLTIAIKELTIAYDPTTRTVTPSWVVTTVFGDTPRDSLDLTGGTSG